MQLLNENDEQTNVLKQRTVITFTLIRSQANRTYREENIKQIKKEEEAGLRKLREGRN
jgi:hypothetical protein